MSATHWLTANPILTLINLAMLIQVWRVHRRTKRLMQEWQAASLIEARFQEWKRVNRLRHAEDPAEIFPPM
jgi:hypothetical protein